jgi:energy-coupling factor transport system ATP-binding protein
MRVRLEQVSFGYERGVQTLRQINLAIEPGEFVAIAGRSGSGKSTLLQVIKGLQLPAEGRVLIDGQGARPEQFDRIGLVFQYPEHQLFAPTVQDDIAFGPRQQGLAEAEVEGRVRRAMADVGLDWERYRERSPFELSGGEKRRVAIAGVLALEPAVLLADEPTAGLDLRGRRALFELLEKLRQDHHIAVVVVTHRLEEVLPHATRLVIMEQGRIAAQGAALDVLSDGAVLHSLGLEVPAAVALRNRLAELGWPVADPPWDVDAVARALLARREGGAPR